MDYSDTIYPACVGLSRIGDYPNIVNELWNDGVTRKVPWYLRIFPMKGTILMGGGGFIIRWKHGADYSLIGARKLLQILLKN